MIFEAVRTIVVYEEKTHFSGEHFLSFLDGACCIFYGCETSDNQNEACKISHSQRICSYISIGRVL